MTGRLLAAVGGCVAVALFVTVAGNHPLNGAWSSPATAFWFVTIAAGVCLPLAVAVVVIGWRQATAELAILGASLTVLSAWSFAHGLATPGHLYGSSGTSDLTALLALPAALAVAAPALVGDNRSARRMILRWREWSAAAVIGNVLGIIVVLTRAPDAELVADSTWLMAASAAAASAGVALLAHRHHRLYLIGRHPGSLVAAASLLYLGIAGLLALLAPPASAAWWVVHALDAAAVVAASAAAVVAYRADATIAEIVAPIVTHDPLVAMELGLSPEVHAFVAALGQKDAITRHHVVRVGELAMRVGVRARLTPSRLRAVGLAALMHDIGKLVIPSSIIDKPGRLTDAEFAVMKTHSEQGAALLEQSSTLSAVAPLVRAHHERPDGTGYPDGLRGDDLTTEMAIVSVCDAWDAMTNDRQYRDGMTREQAAEVLRSGAGTQWRADAVALLLSEVGASSVVGSFARVGSTRRPTAAEHARALCTDAVCTDAIPILTR